MRKSKGKLRSKTTPCLLSDAHSGWCKSTATSWLVHLNFFYWRCVKEVFDTGKTLSSLLIFVLQWVIEINFKKINKGKDLKGIHYTSKAKQGNACKAEWNADMILWILKWYNVLETEGAVLPSRLFILAKYVYRIRLKFFSRKEFLLCVRYLVTFNHFELGIL
jgi:hypothetical protein